MRFGEKVFVRARSADGRIVNEREDCIEAIGRSLVVRMIYTMSTAIYNVHISREVKDFV